MSKFILDVKKKNTVGGGNKIIGVEMDIVAVKNEHFCTENKRTMDKRLGSFREMKMTDFSKRF